MRKSFFWILCAGMFFSCSDGDLQIETIDFDSAAIQFCTAPQTNAKNILFKINESEALILELQSGVLNINFVHTISLSGISFVTESGERITNLSISEFGSVTTAIPAN